MKTSIYLPDDLAEQVRQYRVSMSEVVQEALRAAVRAAILKENVMSDIDAVVDRLRETVNDADRAKRTEGYNDGIEWAKKYATAAELEGIASAENWDYRGWTFSDGHSILDFMSDKDQQHYVQVAGGEDEDPYWEGFVEGAGAVWEAVASKL